MRTGTFVAMVFSFIALSSGTAMAGPGGQSGGSSTLDACLAACASKIHVCVGNMEYHIDRLCKGVPECDGLGTDAVAAGTAMCKACADNSQPGVCPAPAPPPPKPAATTGNGGAKPPPPRVTPQPNTCAARGGVEIPLEGNGGAKACFTIKSAYDRIVALEQRQKELEEMVKAAVAVPPGVPDEVKGNAATLNSISQQLVHVNSEVARYAQNVEQKYRDLDGELRKVVARVTNLEGEMRAVKSDVGDLKSRPLAAPVAVLPNVAATLPNRTFGFSLAAYWGADTYKQYGEFQQAPGLEIGMYHRLGEIDFLGRHNYYVQLFAGGGQPGASSYGAQPMYEWHAGGGFLHNGDIFGLGYGGEFIQRRTTSHHDVRSTFVGGYIEPRLNIYKGLYFAARVGLGSRHSQGQEQDRTTNRFDVPIQLSLGYQILSW